MNNNIIIYHNPKCRKSQAGLQYLKDKGIVPEIKNYLKSGFAPGELENVLMRLNMKPEALFRKQEAEYKAKYRGKHFEEYECLRILLDNPKLIQRPIVMNRYKAVIGDPVENIDNIL